MEQPASGPRRRSDGSVRECLFFPVLERNEQERLEALMKRSMERSLQLDHRPKRWTWGGPTLSAGQEVSLNSHRSPERVPLGRLDQGKANNASQGLSMESTLLCTTVPLEIPQTNMPGEVRGALSPVSTAPARRAESPATPTNGSSPRAQSRPRRVKSSNSRAQMKEEEKATRDIRGLGFQERKTDIPEKKMPKSSSRDLSLDKSTGKPVAGTTDAEEASRLLAERRRQARLQKEQEEKQRLEQEEEERMRTEELLKRKMEECAQQEGEAHQAAEERQEQERKRKEEEERQQRERRWMEVQAQLEREREEMEQRVRKKAERHRQERELLKLQEEQERLQRKKRIEEIMKRTRKGVDAKKEAVQVEPPSTVSLLNSLPSALLRSQGAVQVNGQVRGQSTWMKPTVAPLTPLSVGPYISLGALDMQSCGVDEYSDEVQSMDVSPVSKEDLISIPEFSPVDEVHPIGTNNTCAMEDLLDLTGHVDYHRLSPAHTLGDCNKNLIEGFCNPGAETQLIKTLSPPSDKLNIQ
ncbi:MAP7 domain-containing protein 2-like isoform X2 [Conger conger]|uniref:MAP7 domain-containing protein 2-like isoform X2 n=1 Tax=Conger conger TaxID=82655 RepID=UPI002A5ACAE9|nr:MAP7 domain-containing protein 2-like isoform X2 [Conger conger]